MGRMWAIVQGAVMLAGAALPAAAAETFDFNAPRFQEVREFMRGQAAGEVTVRATLQLPQLPGPWPLIVIAHASEGVTGDVIEVANAMNGAGFAAVYYDSYAARGMSSVRSGGAQVGVVNQAADAFVVLRTLAADPRFDARRVAIVGMSAGGGAAVLTAAGFLQSRVLGPDGPRFAAHVAFYPGLHLVPAASELSGAPILIVQGERDDYQKPARPRAWTSYVRRERPDAPVELVMLANGPHSFLSPSMYSHRWVAEYANASLCPMILILRGPPQYLTVDGEVTATRHCETTRGGTIGSDPVSASQGMEAALAAIRKAFGL